ncbi:hypothetical protein [Treponema primitia]|uniref:hypothetical protein n=1 Tax=Treponema primitia TaxID=88058 RepID=UPI0002D449A3|nr:hypothetical protein [Treponema primitia]
MKNKFIVMGMLAALLTFGLVLSGCGDDGSNKTPWAYPPGPSAAEQFRDTLNALYPGKVAVVGA